jgi:hypothetical protein
MCENHSTNKLQTIHKKLQIWCQFCFFLGCLLFFAWGPDEVCPFLNLDVYPKDMGMIGCKQEQKRWAAVLKYFGARSKRSKTAAFCFIFCFLVGFGSDSIKRL